MRPLPLAALAVVSVVSAACGGSAPDARYPAREDGCPVRSYAGSATIPVDELGSVQVDCAPGSGGTCERQLMNVVCRRGGDVLWGLGENALNSATLVGHAAHSKRATQGPHERGCKLQVFQSTPPMHTENIGPVTARCDQDDSREVCERELEDQACLLGADVLWQVEGPAPEGTPNGIKQVMRGRAAHTK
jgi:hypothetical protein